MTPSRTLIVAGAGIGGLTAALELARRGFRALVLDQANALQDAGAGIQLAPNATRQLRRLGVDAHLRDAIVVPEALSVRDAASGREIVRVPLGEPAALRYGAPYWLVHRADLQAALLKSVLDHPDIDIRLGERVNDFAEHNRKLTVQTARGQEVREEQALALVGADGLWSALRPRLGDAALPRYSGRAAFRGLLPAERVAAEFAAPVVTLWLGPHGHLVHYPVRGGRLINIVAIARDRDPGRNWSEPAGREQVLAAFPQNVWSGTARALLGLPDRYFKWSLYDRPDDAPAGTGPVTLLGDAAHPMLPFLAQGAAMAIEDAAILGECVAQSPDALPAAMRRYETMRRGRIRRVARTVRRTGSLYHLPTPLAALRNLAMQTLGGGRMLTRYDWLYDWRPA